jgi:type IV pilus assembly protein PilN
VSLIEELRKGQSSPVHLLDEISKSLPDRLWLNDMSQAGEDFTMNGLTDSMTAVSDFVANLESTRWFRKPVEIVDTQVQPDAKAGDLIKFQVKAKFVDPSAPPPPPAPVAAAAGRGGK